MGAAKLAGHALLAASIALLSLSILGVEGELGLAGALAGLAHEAFCSALYLAEMRRALRPIALEPLAYSGLASAALALTALGSLPAWFGLAALAGGSLAAHLAADRVRAMLGVGGVERWGSEKCSRLGPEYEVGCGSYR